MDKTPFNVYDFFAYLSSGAVLLATADYVMGLGLLQSDHVTAIFAIFLTILAYSCGQVVAHFSSALLEHTIVVRFLHRPNELLLGTQPRWKILAKIFPLYCQALPAATIARVTAQMESRKVSANGEGVFLHVYATVTTDDKCQKRLDDFRNQYGFARNMCFAFALAALAILIARADGRQNIHLRWAALAIILASTMFYRYLKFFRQFSYELFARYAEWPGIK